MGCTPASSRASPGPQLCARTAPPGTSTPADPSHPWEPPLGSAWVRSRLESLLKRRVRHSCSMNFVCAQNSFATSQALRRGNVPHSCFNRWTSLVCHHNHTSALAHTPQPASLDYPGLIHLLAPLPRPCRPLTSAPSRPSVGTLSLSRARVQGSRLRVSIDSCPASNTYLLGVG